MEKLRQEIFKIILNGLTEFCVETYHRREEFIGMDTFNKLTSGGVLESTDEVLLARRRYSEFREKKIIDITNEVMASIRRESQ